MTVEITSIVAANSGAEVHLHLRISDGVHCERRVLPLLTCQYASLRPQKGEVDTEMLDRLLLQSQICEAVTRGMSMLAYAPSSEKHLINKLRQRGYDGRIAKTAAAYLTRMGYIHEIEDAVREAERCVKKRWGRRRIASSLLEKGYTDEAITEALASLEEDVMLENCVIEVRKRALLWEDAEQRKKAYAALLRLGYSSSQISLALEKAREKREE